MKELLASRCGPGNLIKEKDLCDCGQYSCSFINMSCIISRVFMFISLNEHSQHLSHITPLNSSQSKDKVPMGVPTM